MVSSRRRHKIDCAAKSDERPILPFPTPRPIDAFTARFSSIIRKDIDWLWPGWIALGKLTILDGDPSLGKSTMLLDLAARVSNIGIMPDQKQGVTGNVIVMSAEDTAEDTIKPRLQAAGANEDRIINLSHIIVKGEECPVEVPADFPIIAQKIKENEARLLIIDPLMAFLCSADANKDQEIRRVLFKLSKIAEKYRCAAVCMRHLNKSGTGKAIYRGTSSIGVIGHARTGLLVAEDPDDDSKRILAVSKCKLKLPDLRTPSFTAWLSPLYRKDWVVYAKPPRRARAGAEVSGAVHASGGAQQASPGEAGRGQGDVPLSGLRGFS